MLIFITFCIIIIIQTFFYLFLFGKFSFLKPIKRKHQTLPVSVIICAKNEANNLQKNLPFIANQSYPKFEIVLVNDASTDDTLKIMRDFQLKYSSSKLSIQIQSIQNKEAKGKKSALSLGIDTANNNYLVLTDADCKPISSNWITEITSHINGEKEIILGYGAYQKIENSFLNKLIRFETLITAIQYFSYAKIGKAYMGVGRNMAYKKAVYTKNKGFQKHMHITSGDDDLFINEVSNKQNTEICFSKSSFTVSKPETHFKKWISQKRRHITTANHYKNFHKLLLGLFYISQILFWVLAVLLLVLQINTTITLVLITFRFIIWYLIIGKSAKLLQEKDLIIFAPLYEISLIFIQLYIFTKNILSPPKQW